MKTMKTARDNMGFTFGWGKIDKRYYIPRIGIFWSIDRRYHLQLSLLSMAWTLTIARSDILPFWKGKIKNTLKLVA